MKGIFTMAVAVLLVGCKGKSPAAAVPMIKPSVVLAGQIDGGSPLTDEIQRMPEAFAISDNTVQPTLTEVDLNAISTHIARAPGRRIVVLGVGAATAR